MRTRTRRRRRRRRQAGHGRVGCRYEDGGARTSKERGGNTKGERHFEIVVVVIIFMAQGEASAEGIEDLRQLAILAGVPLKEEVLECVAEIVQQDVIPTAVSQVLRSLSNKAKYNNNNIKGEKK